VEAARILRGICMRGDRRDQRAKEHDGEDGKAAEELHQS
jgi:hypothetical protein